MNWGIMAKRKKATAKTGDTLATSYLQHEALNEMRDYLERGRALQGVTDSDALDVWVASFERWFEMRTAESSLNMDDAAAELRLRNLDLPEERVRSKIDILSAEIRRRGPDATSEVLDRRIDEFLAEYDKPKN